MKSYICCFHDFLLYISIASLSLIPDFFDKNSVTPILLFLKRVSLETGQLIKPIIFLLFISLIAKLKQLIIYLFDLVDIFWNGFCWLKLTLYILSASFFNLLGRVLLFISLILMLYFNFLFCNLNKSILPITKNGLWLYFFLSFQL